MSWLDMMPMVSMVTLLEKSFFPRWLQVLDNWLSQPNPNYYEVTSWYQGWKAQFPEKLLAEPAIKGPYARMCACVLFSWLYLIWFFRLSILLLVS